jgi:colanic acid/amylovoran biosynthesis glycosyltransferase
LATVGHVTKRYFSLSENWIHTQLKYLNEWTPLVLTQHTKNRDSVDWWPDTYARVEDLPFLIRKLDGGVRRILGFNPSRYLWARRHDARIIHAHFGPVGYHSLALARVLNVPLVTTFYGYDASQLLQREPEWHERYPHLFEEGDLFLAEGPHMARQLKSLGCPPEKIRVHRLGIETDLYPYRPRRRGEKEPFRVLMVGRFVKKKGMCDGVRAFVEFLERGGEGKLTIIGDAREYESSQATKRRLYRTVDEFGVQEHVDFRGLVPKSELREAYYNHHIFLAPSRTGSRGDNEGGAPVTIIEAQASGMPVVATRHCDIPNVVQEGESGLLAEERDVEELGKHLELLADSTDRLGEMGRQGHRYITENHDARMQGEELDRLYDDIQKRCVAG